MVLEKGKETSVAVAKGDSGWSQRGGSLGGCGVVVVVVVYPSGDGIEQLSQP